MFFFVKEFIIVLNGSIIKNDDQDSIRLAQTENLETWVDFLKSTGEIKLHSNTSVKSTISISSLKSDLSNNQFHIILSLRANQLATFYNCNLNDAVMLEDASLATHFLSKKITSVNGKVAFIFLKKLKLILKKYFVLF